MGCGASKNSVADASSNANANETASASNNGTPSQGPPVNVFSVLDLDALSPDGSPPVKSSVQFKDARDAKVNTSPGGVSWSHFLESMRHTRRHALT